MHITLVDFFIALLGIVAAVRGYQIGMLRQASSTLGFILGLYPGTVFSSLVMQHVEAGMRPLVGLGVILFFCFVGMTLGEIVAVRIKHKVTHELVHKADNTVGSVASFATLLIGCWLAAALLALAPPSNLQQQLRQSAIISTLNRNLPSVASLLHQLNTFTSTGQTPDVFAGKEPAPDAHYPLPDVRAASPMLSRVQQSVLKVEGLGCGGIVDGSSFVYAPNLVVTNAHVVAGVSSPKVSHNHKTYDAVPVLFDSANDIAVLRVEKLTARPLNLVDTPLKPGTAAFALGYPGGGDFNVKPAAILDKFNAAGQDIYGKKRTIRNVYSLQTALRHGNSGGPIVDTDGNVIGVVFATSTTYNNIGYALTLDQLQAELATAEQQTQEVNTGQCSQ